MSYYLNSNNALERLRDDYAKHGTLIIAVDVDSTLIPFMPHEITANFEPVRQLIRDLKKIGCTIIIFTAADETRHESIKHKLQMMNVPWDLFNESPSYIPNIGKTGKVYANAYLDDRAGLAEVFGHLSQILTEIELKNAKSKLESVTKLLKSY